MASSDKVIDDDTRQTKKGKKQNIKVVPAAPVKKRMRVICILLMNMT